MKKIKKINKKSYNENEIYELDDKQIADLRAQGYQVDIEGELPKAQVGGLQYDTPDPNATYRMPASYEEYSTLVNKEKTKKVKTVADRNKLQKQISDYNITGEITTDSNGQQFQKQQKLIKDENGNLVIDEYLIKVDNSKPTNFNNSGNSPIHRALAYPSVYVSERTGTTNYFKGDPAYDAASKQGLGASLMDGMSLMSPYAWDYALGQVGTNNQQGQKSYSMGDEFMTDLALSGPAALTGNLAKKGLKKGVKELPSLINKGRGMLDNVAEYATTQTPLRDAYKLNPRALKETQEQMLVRARPVGQNPYINMAEQMRAKEAAGEQLKWYQKNLLNPQTNPQMAAREKYFGQWFADNPSDLDFYINPETRNFADDAQIEILKARMPKSEAAKYNVKNFEDAKSLSNLHDTEYILPKDMVQSTERFSVKDLPNLQAEYKQMNTPHWLKGYQEIPNQQSTFKSEINWGKWNKEIPENKALMQEYNAIEQQTKANGTWMKNPDGSEFTGTPEQFVQQNSENFKKAFPEWEKMYHGSKSDNLQDLDISKSERQAFGEGFYTTDNIEEAQKYAGLLKRTPNPDGKVYELAVNTKNSQKFSFDDKDFLSKWNNSNLKSKEQFLKDYKLKYGEDAPDYYLKQAESNVAFKENIPNNMKDLSKNIILDEGYQNKWILAKDYSKSLINNNGMFDMTNPNIYKSVGAGIGAYSLSNPDFKSPLSTYQTGGVIEDDMGQWNHPGKVTKINSNYITMEGVNYPVLGVSDTGHQQMMYPNQNYKFRGNSVTEYPILDNELYEAMMGGIIGHQINPTQLPEMQDGGQPTYNDSLILYEAYQFQKNNMPKSYESTMSDYAKTMTDFGKPTTIDEIKAIRNKNLGPPGTTFPNDKSNHFYKSLSYDPADNNEKNIINYYKKLTQGNSDFRIGDHSSPDLWHKNINPVGSYFDGVGMNPIYHKPGTPFKSIEKSTSNMSTDWGAVLREEGKDGSYKARKQMYIDMGMEAEYGAYKGSAEQNIAALNMYKNPQPFTPTDAPVTQNNQLKNTTVNQETVEPKKEYSRYVNIHGKNYGFNTKEEFYEIAAKKNLVKNGWADANVPKNMKKGGSYLPKAQNGKQINKFNLNNPVLTDEAYDYINYKKNGYCPGGNCLETTQKVYNMLNKNSNVNFDFYNNPEIEKLRSEWELGDNEGQEAIDSWDYAGMRKANGDEVIDLFDYKGDYNFPLGTMISLGPEGGSTYRKENENANNAQGLRSANHSVQVVKYDKFGSPVVYDGAMREYFSIHQLANKWPHYKAHYASIPKGSKDLTYDKLKDQKTEEIKSYTDDPTYLANQLSSFLKDNYKDKKISPERYTNIINSLNKYKVPLVNLLDISESEYDNLSNAYLGIVANESGGTNSFKREVKNLFGDTYGDASFNINNILDDEFLLKKIIDSKIASKKATPSKSDIKSAYKNDRNVETAVNLLYLNESKKRAIDLYEKNKSSGVRTYYNQEEGMNEIKGWFRENGSTFNDKGFKIEGSNDYTDIDGLTDKEATALLNNKAGTKDMYKVYTKDGKRAVDKVTSGNSTSLSDSQILDYYWQSPNSLRTGDAQGMSTRSELISDLENVANMTRNTNNLNTVVISSKPKKMQKGGYLPKAQVGEAIGGLSSIGFEGFGSLVNGLDLSSINGGRGVPSNIPMLKDMIQPTTSGYPNVDYDNIQVPGMDQVIGDWQRDDEQGKKVAEWQNLNNKNPMDMNSFKNYSSENSPVNNKSSNTGQILQGVNMGLNALATMYDNTRNYNNMMDITRSQSYDINPQYRNKYLRYGANVGGDTFMAQDGGLVEERELTDKEIDDLRSQGYQVDILV